MTHAFDEPGSAGRLMFGQLDERVHNLTLVVDSEGVLSYGPKSYSLQLVFESVYSLQNNHSSDWRTAGWALDEDGNWRKVSSCPASTCNTCLTSNLT